MIDILGSIDEKIENNIKKGVLYEHLIEQYFKELLLLKNDSWQELTLTQIADYINGLAMQKFRPKGQDFLPVIKIKELSQGASDKNSEQADPFIDLKYIIDDGDIIFSWSGTLMVKIWCGGKGGLNQHLFKVVPKNQYAWFVYLWTNYHLVKFQNIAKGKAVTMGHIKREDLEKSLVYAPPQNVMDYYNKIIQPLYQSIIDLNVEKRKLDELKNLYLKKFFS